VGLKYLCRKIKSLEATLGAARTRTCGKSITTLAVHHLPHAGPILALSTPILRGRQVHIGDKARRKGARGGVKSRIRKLTAHDEKLSGPHDWDPESCGASRVGFGGGMNSGMGM